MAPAAHAHGTYVSYAVAAETRQRQNWFAIRELTFSVLNGYARSTLIQRTPDGSGNYTRVS